MYRLPQPTRQKPCRRDKPIFGLRIIYHEKGSEPETFIIKTGVAPLP